MTIPAYTFTATGQALPRLALDFTTGVLDSRVAVARALNTATRINASGYIELVNADLPRFDHDPVTLAPKGLLIEETRTNALTYSEDYTNVVWVPLRASIAPDAAVSPYGTSDADKLVEDTTATSTHVLTRSNLSFVSGTTYSLSIYLKAAGRNVLRISSGNNTTWGASATFNIANGTIVRVFAGTASIFPVGGGWYRCTITGVSGATAATSFSLVMSDGTTESYTGDGTSGIFIWGAQLEAGAFPTSYIPTSNTSLTRNADVMSLSDFTDFWRAGQGSALVRARPFNVSEICPVLQFDDGTADNIIALRGNGADPELYVKTGGVDQAQIDAGTIEANTSYRLAGAWAENSCAASLNSGTPVLDGVATIPTVTQARLGSDGTNYLNGHLEAVEYYDERVLNASLQVVSSTAGYQSIIGSVFRDAIIS
jgi:hypothetical protein